PKLKIIGKRIIKSPICKIKQSSFLKNDGFWGIRIGLMTICSFANKIIEIIFYFFISDILHVRLEI
ncbi:MAG: hypothetical protein U9R19_03075, partial [Bacteroidota bacterium]|nr:hypothetical protein [Bacteroidota bacterium]